MFPNFFTKRKNKSEKKEQKEQKESDMCSRASPPSDEVICCGIKIDFFEECGHTMTIADHDKSCVHFNSEASFPYDHRYAHLLAPRSAPPRPKSMISDINPKLPFPQPHCRDLHRYIDIVPGKCGCLFPKSRHSSLSAAGLVPQRSERTKLTDGMIKSRRVYWEREKALDDEITAGIELAQLRKRQRQEEEMSIPLADRTFVYDPDQGANVFLGAVDVALLTKEQETCAFCQKGASNRDSRKLPCGCVFDVECLNRWFLCRKDCPLCRKEFRLVKKHTRYLTGHGTPLWDDDDYAAFL